MIKLITRALKKNRKSFIGLMSCITLTTMVLVLLICFFSSEGYTDYIHTKEKIGTYNYLIDTVSEFEQSHNNEFVTMTDSNTISNYGNYAYGIVGSIDHTNLISVKLKEGRLPEKENEVAIDLVHLYQLGFTTDHLNQPIEVEYTLYDGTVQKEKLILCGILDEYYTVCTHPTMIVTERHFDSIQHIFFTGEIDYGKIYDYKEKNHIDDFLWEYNNVYNNQLHYISIQQGLEFTKIVMMIVVAFMINVMNMNRILKNQENDILLLRGIGAKKGQIVMMILGESIVILMISLLVGSILGLILSNIIVKMNQFIFHLETELFIECLIISSLPLIFAVIFPTFRALNVSLNGRVNKKIKRVKTNYHQLIHIPFLFYRRIQQNRGKVFLYFVGGSLAFALSINFFYRLNSRNITDHLKEEQYNSDYWISSSGKMDNEKIIEEIRKNVNMKEVQIYGVVENEIKLDQDTDYGIWDMNLGEVTHRGRLSVETIDFYQSPYLQQLGIDEEQYANGKVAFIYAPKQIHYLDSDKQSHYESYNELMSSISGVDVIQENAKDIQQVEYHGEKIQVVAVIENLDGLMIYNKRAVQPYTIFMSSINIYDEEMANSETDIYIQTTNELYDDVIYAKLRRLFEDDTVFAEQLFKEEAVKSQRKQQFEKLMYFLPLFSFFLLIIHEMISDIENTRKNQIGIYHLVGLSYKDILKLVMMDISVFVGVTGLLGTVLGLYISTYQFNRFIDPLQPSLIERVKFLGLYTGSSYLIIVMTMIVIFVWSNISMRYRIRHLFNQSSKEQSKDY